MHEEKGLALCAEFFHTCGEAMLGRDFAAQRHRIAAGLCGEGSECFGFDDAVSRDHDFGPRFFLFLTEEDNASFGYALARAYAALPQEFHGVRRLAANTVGAPRGGVLTIPAFYRRFTGCPGVPPENLAWLAVPEYALACAVSGAVFSDPLGEFSKIRAQLAKGYPEDVRRKKTAARAIEMAQAGQYNYMRCIRHGEAGAARMALHVFCEAALSMLYLLNRRYMPFYKWALRGARELPRLQGLADSLETLLCSGGAPSGAAANQALIEQICARIAAELRAQGLSAEHCDYLEPHAFSVFSGITDQKLRALDIFAG